MKSNAPWSVKGIERDARETAKEAARREGMTVGEWLSQMIYTQAEGGGDATLSGGEVEGLKLRDIVTAIEHLRNRAVQAETKNAAAMAELTRNMGGFVERVQRLERVKPADGSYPDLAARLEKLERAGGERNRIEALKALEKAVSQVAIQFNSAQRTTLTRLDSAEQQLQEFAERIDRVGGADGEPAGLSSLKETIDGLAERITRAERIAEEAASLKSAAADSSDPEFVEQTGARLRVLGDEIKRGGDQIRTLEGAIDKLSGQIEAAEKRSADGVQKVADTIAEVRSQLVAKEAQDNSAAFEEKIAQTRSDMDARLETLQRSLEEVKSRFDELGRASAPAPVAPQNADALKHAAAAVKAAPSLKAPVAEPAAAEAPATDGAAPFIDDVVNEIEEAVAALEEEEATEPEAASEDPFAFSEDSAEDESDDIADDFSFQLDDDETESADDAKDDGDITVSTEDGASEQDRADAQALLADVRNALSSEGFEEKKSASEPSEADDDISALFADDDDAAPAADPDGNQDDDDEQAPNTASLTDKMPVDTGETPAAPETEVAEAPKEDMLTAARRRAREAAALNAEQESARPRRGQLTPKQRAILAARARQKRAAEAAALQSGAPQQTGESETPSVFSDQAIEEEEDESPRGRFGKITAALSSARARLGRKNDDEDETESVEAKDDDTQSVIPQEDETRSNGDRAALKTLQSTASARPLTLALGVAIILSIAALVYLMKDFIFPSDDASTRQPGAITFTPEPAPAANDPEAAATDTTLVEVPEAPAVDPQVLFAESIDALNTATSDADAMAAIAKLQDAAALGFPPAQLQLGELYKTGQGVEQDLGQARVWFRRAANGGNVLAMHRIGVMTARGDGGAADPQEAVGWFEQAANFGLVDSQYNLGAIFHPGDDGTATSIQDAGEAYFWYSLAARNGDDQAQPLAAGVAVALTPEARADIDARVAGWRAQPADEAANANAVTD